MVQVLKALVIVLVCAFAMFRLARPICLTFMSAEAFDRRRNIWFLLTTVAFVTQNFWMYAAVAFAVLLWATSRDENPPALYVLMTFLVPNVGLIVPVPGVNQLFDMTHYRLLSFAILIPACLRIARGRDPFVDPRLGWLDVSVIAFLALQVVQGMPYGSITNTLRNTFLAIVDTYLIVYVFARVGTMGRLREILACFWLSCLLMAPMAIFESLRSWLLYVDLTDMWGSIVGFAYLLRGDALRAQVAANHSLNLGYVLAMALTVHVYLRGWIRSWAVWMCAGLMTVALIVTYGRGPWITAILSISILLVLMPNGWKKVLAYGFGALVVVGIALQTPYGNSLAAKLPFIGTADQGSVDYRARLAEVSWALIKQKPLFGDPFVFQQMESLRQGQGIIDIVNAYIYVALFNGLIGVALFVWPFLLALKRTAGVYFRARRIEPDVATLAAMLLAAMLSSLVFIATAGYGMNQYEFAGLMVSLAIIIARPIPQSFQPASAPERAWRPPAAPRGAATRRFSN